MFTKIPPELVKFYWPSIVDLVQDAIDATANYLTPESVFTTLLAGTQQLWISNDPRAIIITQILDLPTAKICYFALLAGNDLNKILAGTDDIVSWAKSIGCTKRHIGGRPGWVKVLKARGYKLTSVTLDAEI